MSAEPFLWVKWEYCEEGHREIVLIVSTKTQIGCFSPTGEISTTQD